MGSAWNFDRLDGKCIDVTIRSSAVISLTQDGSQGVSGAGKTTLLNVLANRVTTGVVTGTMLVDGTPSDASFQRKTGYVQQQDVHLSACSVRESLEFSALLRQPASVSREEKLDYAGEVIRLLEMEEYADAIIGIPGEGLNIEQRRRLTIGIELAAKPELLLFLDEPTSGLDSQTSWAICHLLKRLARSGQAILCTIHQPSAILFKEFDNLLLLARGGKTVYFGGLSAALSPSLFPRGIANIHILIMNIFFFSRNWRGLSYSYPVSGAQWSKPVSSWRQPGRVDVNRDRRRARIANHCRLAEGLARLA
jgi:ABC-type cobalamin/Fe3+-siderophores transport system ATPase subunit